MAEPITIALSVFSLLWDIYKRVTDNVVQVENNREVNSSEAKRKHVEQNAYHEIDGLDMPDVAKAEAKRNVTAQIEYDVKRFNENGMFAHDEPKGKAKE
jgi:hypothetical protein